ncbi:CaiB/BaiF CoA transferase family protein [Microbulbifer sp.]|uniref:CaiB/BaiF CoA transferase family protein n=1 Tax=Microbulbifer sp. TaxID=1908541 RepID=UPI003F419E67
MQNNHGPLAGLKILDFTTRLPGPYATMLLADMGAEVLRIESPTRPDMFRGLPPMVGADKSISAAHATLNRNKKSLALDLKAPKAVEIVRRLLVEYDVVLEQFRPGLMDNLGLGFDALREAREDLIYCSITGYGQTGPLNDRVGHDINYLALSGLASYSGRRESGPSLAGTQVAGIAGSHHAVMSILAAVYKRSQNGEGSRIDIAMTDCAFAMNAISGACALAGGGNPEIESELLNGGSYYDYYRTADNRYLSVGSLEPQLAEHFFTALGKPQWLSRIVQEDQQESLKRDVAELIAQQPLDKWLRLFADIDACVEPVLDFLEAAQSQQMQQRQMICEATDSSGEGITQINTPFLFDGEKPQRHSAGAPLGAHSRELLGALGYSGEDIEQLQADDVIG